MTITRGFGIGGQHTPVEATQLGPLRTTCLNWARVDRILKSDESIWATGATELTVGASASAVQENWPKFGQGPNSVRSITATGA